MTERQLCVSLYRREAKRLEAHLGSDTGSSTVGASEDDGAGDVSTGHVVGLAGRVDNLVDGLEEEKAGDRG